MIIRSVKCRVVVSSLLIASAMLLLGKSLYAQTPDTNPLKAAGIRTLKSKHLTLYTDIPAQADVEDLPKVFELAIPQWTSFFKVDAKTLDDWHVVACVIRNKQRFTEYELLPRDVPPFLYGLQMFDNVWVYDQPSDYYRRHLLLHEATHAVMNRIFGRVGPAWYREGLAEMLATHRFRNGKLELAHFPDDKKLVELWGRIKIVNDQVREGSARSISSIVNTHVRDFLNVESYAWSWALHSFGHKHPKFAPMFHELQEEMHHSNHGVTARFLTRYDTQRYEVDTAWELFLSQLDYGYDSSAELIDRSAVTTRLDGQIATVHIDTMRGWQSTGLLIPPNSTVDIAASGRFQIARDSRPWICEPQGVTVEYYQKRPLGILLSAIVDPNNEKDTSALANPSAVGRRGKLTTSHGGILYLRINERADRLWGQQRAGYGKSAAVEVVRIADFSNSQPPCTISVQDLAR